MTKRKRLPKNRFDALPPSCSSRCPWCNEYPVGLLAWCVGVRPDRFASELSGENKTKQCRKILCDPCATARAELCPDCAAVELARTQDGTGVFYHDAMTRAECLLQVVGTWPKSVFMRRKKDTLEDEVEAFLASRPLPYVSVGKCDHIDGEGRCAGHLTSLAPPE